MLEPESLHPNLQKMDWSFFGTAHGKGPVDGIGGTVKRTVWRRILQRRALINSAEEFADVARECCPSIKILFVSKKEIEATKERLDAKWIQNPVKTIPGTQALHYAVAASASDLKVQPISPFYGIRCDVKVVNIIELAQTTASSNDVSQLNEVSSVSSDADTAAAAIQDELVPDDYVVVMYDGKTYAGVIAVSYTHLTLPTIYSV